MVHCCYRHPSSLCLFSAPSLDVSPSFHCTATLVALPSFPTRRSSDLVVSICIKIRKNKFKTIKKRHLFRCFFYFINSFPDLDFVLFLHLVYELVQIRSFYVLNLVFLGIVMFYTLLCFKTSLKLLLCHSLISISFFFYLSVMS